MSSIGTGYDLSASQFSPDGRVFQVEYAQKAVENSGTAIALRAKDGIVFAVEKLVISKLYESTSNQRIFTIDKHIGMAVGGLLADARHLVETARDEAANYRNNYNMPIPISYLANRISMYMHAHTLYSSVRPFGCGILLGGVCEDGPELFSVDPSGVYYGYYGCAIGKAKQNAKTEMEKLKIKDMTMKQLIKEVAKIIYVVHDEVKDKNFELELSWVGTESNNKHERIPKNVYTDAEKFAKEAIAESDASDEDL